MEFKQKKIKDDDDQLKNNYEVAIFNEILWKSFNLMTSFQTSCQ